MSNPDTYQAIGFLTGIVTDQHGRDVHEYMGFSPEKWEECHDHIQWAFPSNIPSAFNMNAPVVDFDDMNDALAKLEPQDRDFFFWNVETLLDMYVNSIRNRSSEVFGQAWDHNFQRITRIINFIVNVPVPDDVTSVHWLRSSRRIFVKRVFTELATYGFDNGHLAAAGVYWAKALAKEL